MPPPQTRILVGRDVVEGLPPAVGPDHTNFHGTVRVAEADEHARVARRRVAAVRVGAAPYRPIVAGGAGRAARPHELSRALSPRRGGLARGGRSPTRSCRPRGSGAIPSDCRWS